MLSHRVCQEFIAPPFYFKIIYFNYIHLEYNVKLCLLTIKIVKVLNWKIYAYTSASQARVCPSTSYTPSRHKRSYEEDEDMELHPSKQREQHLGISWNTDSF